MFDYDRLIGEVREDCNKPEGHAPDDDLIMQKSGDVAQLLVNELAEAAKYRILFNTGAIPEPSQNTVAPIPAEWYRYWRIETSLLTLRYCHWRGRDHQARKDEIAMPEPVLTRQSTQFKEAWEQFKLTNRVSGAQESSGYADWYLSGDPCL
jgi:hypothetical protein